jgi:hypothetical protein
MKAVYEALTKMKFQFENSLESSMLSGRVRATLKAGRGEVGIACQVRVIVRVLLALRLKDRVRG